MKMKIKNEKRKISVGILMGGKSPEHEVSLCSAKNVIAVLDKNKYQPVLIGITKENEFLYFKENADFLLNKNNPKKIKLNLKIGRKIVLPPGKQGAIVDLKNEKIIEKIDVFFPVLHGFFGEDGTIQGYLKMIGAPFVGADVLGSAIGMDKGITKKLLIQAGIKTVEFIVLNNNQKIDFKNIVRKLGLPFFIKPTNTGSSIGIHKVKNKKEFKWAIKDAFQFGPKILAEKYIRGREIECAVLGNEKPIASVLGEIIPRHEFYSYAAKYLDENGAQLVAPAKLLRPLALKIRKTAVAAYLALACSGMARVDFFVSAKNEIYVSEINTIPGFTSISMYPRLWSLSGLKYPKLIDKLIQLACEKFQQDKKIKTSY